MIKAVVFDLDHTLFDRHGTLRKLVPAFRQNFKVKKDITDEEIGDKWVYADDHFVYFGWQYILFYLAENGIFEEVPPFDEYRSFVYKYFAKVAVSFPDTSGMLDELRRDGYKIGLITNGSHSLQYKKLYMLNITDKFDEIIVSGDVMIDKPDRDIFYMMCEKFCFDPSDMVYVGDNPINDIEGARKAGYKTIWMKSTGFWEETILPADRTVCSVAEIPDAVRSLDI